MSLIAQPSKADEISVYPIPVIESEILQVTLQPELPYSVLSNCYNYLTYRLGNVPPTKTILNNLTESGNIGVLYYPRQGLYHYVVVESVVGDQVTFTETNFHGHTKSTRVLAASAFLGFYSL